MNLKRLINKGLILAICLAALSAIAFAAPALTVIAVTPVGQTIVVGLTLQFTATGTYSDGSTQVITGAVTWSSDDTDVAVIAADGMATGVTEGATTIRATSGVISGSTALRVMAAAPPGTTILTNRIDTNGVFTTTVTATSPDGKVWLTIDKGVKGLTKGRVALAELTMVETATPTLPANASIISLAYDLGPSGATFDPPIKILFGYDATLVPQGVAEEDLVIAMRDATTGNWAVLDSNVVNTTNHTITAKVSHFTAFTVLAYIRPAAFMVSGLSISPREAEIGGTVTIGAVVANTGDLAGSYTVTLKVNDVAVATKDLTLAGGASDKVTFTTSKDTAGTYSVAVGSQSGTFVVRPAPAAFGVSALSITPAEVEAGEEVTISVVVANTGGVVGGYRVTLKVNDVAVANKDVLLAAGASEKVTFATAKDLVGTYSVDVNGLTGTFVVKPAPPVTPTTPTLPPVPLPPPVNWWLIGGIIGGAIVVGLIIWMVMARLQL